MSTFHASFNNSKKEAAPEMRPLSLGPSLEAASQIHAILLGKILQACGMSCSEEKLLERVQSGVTIQGVFEATAKMATRLSHTLPPEQAEATRRTAEIFRGLTPVAEKFQTAAQELSPEHASELVANLSQEMNNAQFAKTNVARKGFENLAAAKDVGTLGMDMLKMLDGALQQDGTSEIIGKVVEAAIGIPGTAQAVSGAMQAVDTAKTVGDAVKGEGGKIPKIPSGASLSPEQLQQMEKVASGIKKELQDFAKSAAKEMEEKGIGTPERGGGGRRMGG